MACLAADVKKGDEEITTPITFLSSANCALHCGAIPVFADIDKETYNIDPKQVELKITKKTKAVIAVDYTGQETDLNSLQSIVKSMELF
jgi:perosamine synthetase